MTNTKFRRRALVSSIAMLLVALIALGSATFAWFTANPNAYAQGVKMRTTASTGLVVRTETDTNWSHAAALRNGESTYFNLTPVSQEQSKANSGNFWTVSAAKSNEYGHSTAAADAMTQATAGTDYYTEKVYFNLSAGSDVTGSANKEVYLTGVTITAASGATMQNAIRVSVTAADGTMLGTWSLSTAGNGTLTTASKTSGSFSPALAATGTSLNVPTGQMGLAADGSLTKYVNVYCYLDGQSEVCTSDNVGTNNAEKIIESVKVDFTLKDHVNAGP